MQYRDWGERCAYRQQAKRDGADKFGDGNRTGHDSNVPNTRLEGRRRSEEGLNTPLILSIDVEVSERLDAEMAGGMTPKAHRVGQSAASVDASSVINYFS